MRLLLDAGALIAMERGDHLTWSHLENAQRSGAPVVTHGGIVGQVWRGGSGRQARLGRTLREIDVLPLDEDLGRQAGVLLGRTGRSDVIDAALAALAEPDDRILTSDADDLLPLVDATGFLVDIVTV